MLLLLLFFLFFRFTGIKQKSKPFTFSWNPCTKFSIPSHCNDVLVSLCYCYYALNVNCVFIVSAELKETL